MKNFKNFYRTAVTGALVPLTVSLWLGGCGTSVYSCDLRNASTMEHTCREYQGITDNAQLSFNATDCSDPTAHGGASGTWAAVACSHQDAVGGCRQSAGGTMLTLWFYTGSTYTATSVMQSCPEMYVSP